MNRLLISLTLLLLLGNFAQANEVIHHELFLSIDATTAQIEANDKITLPEDVVKSGKFKFKLNRKLALVTSGKHIKKHRTKGKEAVPTDTYEIQLKEGDSITLSYKGRISTPKVRGREYARSFEDTPGVISKDGAFLSAGSYWFPVVDDTMVTFDVSVSTQPGWKAVSQGKRVKEEVQAKQTISQWQETHPQDDFYIIAAAFVEYSQKSDGLLAMAFLREKDDNLAQKYLDTTFQYHKMYQELLGPYPYEKFALVENFWETGYGMPSFTLLGPQVIRFPFILHSSYPHELLHNYWGNGVFVDYSRGNWAEGLTAYLADHLIQEQRGKSDLYRRDTLQKYTDFVGSSKDFPLKKFISRHSAATEAVGYGKTLMLFHMLRMKIGDEVFIQGAKNLFGSHKFKQANFSDVELAFSKAAKEDLAEFFKQWVDESGAPFLKLTSQSVQSVGDKYQVDFDLRQTQKGNTYSLHIPVAISTVNNEKAKIHWVDMDKRSQSYSVQVAQAPIHIAVDPEFDVFRRLDYTETPAALSQGFGADKILVVLSRNESAEMHKVWKDMSNSWRHSQSGKWQVMYDDDIIGVPRNNTVWFLGWNNKFKEQINENLSAEGYSFADNDFVMSGQRFEKDKHSMVIALRNKEKPQQTLLWVGSNNPQAITGLTRKLPHYRKYSYLVFEGDEPSNVHKGQWSTLDSPLQASLAKDGLPKSYPKRVALAKFPEEFSIATIKRDLETLASESMEGRGIGTKGLDQAADYIAGQFKDMGLSPASPDDSFFQEFEVEIGQPAQEVTLRNVLAKVPGTNPSLEAAPLIVSAHYDHLGKNGPGIRSGDEGKTHYGADDNASGVSVMLEMARYAIKKLKPQRPIIFAAFTGEESKLLGSNHFVSNSKLQPIGIINLDTVGRLGESPITVFGTGSASEWVHIFRGAQFVTGVNIKSVADDFGSSDQKSFIDKGIPGVQFFATAHSDFHRPSDTLDKIDYEGLEKVITVLREAVVYLANRTESLTVAGQAKSLNDDGQQGAPGERTVSIGTIPDFSFGGPGVLITGTLPDSPAEKAGLKEGDILTAINRQKLDTLRSYSQYLKKLKPGDWVKIQFARDGQPQVVNIKVVAR
ncbi:MAG: M28 family peptidase [Gammaproteobacteria bacterium]|nr:M28 family peptidase [Gammaproteobacteria bacterium]